MDDTAPAGAAPGAATASNDGEARPPGARSGGFIGSANLAGRGLDRVFAFTQIVIVAYAFGATNGADTFFLASIVPLTIGVVVGESLNRSLVTMLVAAEREGTTATLAATGAFISVGVVAALLAVYLVVALPVVSWLEPGGSGALRPWIAFAPLAVAIALTGYLGGLLIWLHRYVWAALRYPLGGGAALLLVAAAVHFTNGLNTVAAGVSVGYAAALVPLYLAVSRTLGAGWLWRVSRRGFRQAWAGRRRFGAGLGAGLLGGQLIVLLERLLAAPLGAGAVSSLAYARGVAGAPALATEALAAGAYPGFVRAHAAGDVAYLRASFIVWFRVSVLAGLAFTVFYVGFGHDVVAVLFQRGRFGAFDVGRTGDLLVAFAFSTLAGGVAALFVTTLYGLDRFSGILLRELGVFATYLILAPLLRHGHDVVGLAWAFSLAQGLGALVAGSLVVSRLGFGPRALLREGIAPLAASAALLVLALALLRVGLDRTSLGAQGRAVIAVVGTLLLVLAWTAFAQLPEARRVRSVAARISARRPRA